MGAHKGLAHVAEVMRAGRPEVGWRGQLITWEGTRAWLSRGPGSQRTS
jgi:hypothetical protein